VTDRADNAPANAWHNLRESEAPTAVSFIRITVATVFSMLPALVFLFLFLVDAGSWSLDARTLRSSGQ
jgi:hypothetical protein